MSAYPKTASMGTVHQKQSVILLVLQPLTSVKACDAIKTLPVTANLVAPFSIATQENRPSQFGQ